MSKHIKMKNEPPGVRHGNQNLKILREPII